MHAGSRDSDLTLLVFPIPRFLKKCSHVNLKGVQGLHKALVLEVSSVYDLMLRAVPVS